MATLPYPASQPPAWQHPGHVPAKADVALVLARAEAGRRRSTAALARPVHTAADPASQG